MARLENRGNGSWRVTLSGGYGPDGKQIRMTRTVHVDPKSTENSQRKQAEKEAALLEADYRRHLITDANRISFSSAYEDYMEDRIRRRGLAPRTEMSYRDLFRGKLLPYFGKTYIQDITARDVNRFLRTLSDAGYAGTYAKKYYQQLHELMVYCVRMGYITVNPCDAVESPKNDTPESKFYEREEAIQILKALADYPLLEWRLFFTLSIYTGMRPGELIGLDWTDLEGDILTVQAGCVQLKGEKCKRTDKPKTKKSVRKIKLPNDAVKLLKQWRIRQTEYRLPFGNAWPEKKAIFTGPEGYRIREDTASRNWKKFTSFAGIRHLRLYDLRHTNATLMISQGLNVQDVSSRLGHSQTSTTLNVYAHSFLDANERATEAVLSALAAGE